MTFFSTGSFTLTTNTDDYINYDLIVCGNPVNITGWTFYFTAKMNPSLPDSQASLSISQSVHTDPVNGKTSFPVSKTATANMLPGKYYYDVTTKDSSGKFASWTNDAFYLVQSIRDTTT